VFSTNSTISEAHTSHVNDDHRSGLTTSPTPFTLSPDPFLLLSSIPGIYDTDDPPPLDCRDTLVTPNIVPNGNSLHTDVKEVGESCVQAVDITSVDSVVPATNCMDLWCYKMSCWGNICHIDHYDGPPRGLLDPSSPVHPRNMSDFPFLTNACS
jgi:hypothetical protein